jgi:hypothetical protein
MSDYDAAAEAAEIHAFRQDELRRNAAGPVPGAALARAEAPMPEILLAALERAERFECEAEIQTAANRALSDRAIELAGERAALKAQIQRCIDDSRAGHKGAHLRSLNLTMVDARARLMLLEARERALAAFRGERGGASARASALRNSTREAIEAAIEDHMRDRLSGLRAGVIEMQKAEAVGRPTTTI